MTAYYNENDPKAAAWLRELIKHGHIADGVVDEKSIIDIRPLELAKYTQCHFFAGIGGWSYALRLAGWPDDRPVWTGSCPCQPFSAAGKGKGFADERHLWPAWFHLIHECVPDIIFGEQVATNLAWLELISTDLESQGYALGAAIVGAHSVCAPHIRQRLYWMADSQRGGWREERPYTRGIIARDSAQGESSGLEPSSSNSGLGNTKLPNAARQRLLGIPVESQQEAERSSYANPWEKAEFVGCADGKARPVEPGTFPLANGFPGRVGLLRGYGNAIVPQVAAEFITAAQSSIGELACHERV